jgi:hypothetical protein
MYDQAKLDVSRIERKVQRLEYQEKHILPLDMSDLKMSAPPTPDPFVLANRAPLSATSATQSRFDGSRRRSSSFSEHPPPPPPPREYSNWHMGGIQEMTPPVTPRGTSPAPAPVKTAVGPENMGRRRYSGSGHMLGGKGMNGVIKSPGREFPPGSIDGKASWE